MDDLTYNTRQRVCKRPSGDKHDHTLVRQDRCYGCEVDRLTAEVSRQWISVEDRLPARFQDVMMIHDNGVGEASSVMLGWHNGKWFEAGYYHHKQAAVIPDEDVTHWMPLPSAPVSGRQEP